MDEERTTDPQRIISYLRQENRPTAICGSIDMLTIKIAHLAQRLGLRIPEDIAFTGFDDVLASRYMNPMLTTVHQPTEEVGRVAAEMLFRQIENPDFAQQQPEHIRINGELMIRESCGAADPLDLID